MIFGFGVALPKGNVFSIWEIVNKFSKILLVSPVFKFTFLNIEQYIAGSPKFQQVIPFCSKKNQIFKTETKFSL